MSSGLYAGARASISALTAYGTRVADEADNVAKAGAVAGKAREAFVLSASSSDSLTSFSPGGVTTVTQQFITTIGDVTESDVPTFMALRGQGLFVVKSSPVAGIGQSGFTGNGTFAPDKDGNFCNLAGQFLMVWPTDAKGNVTAVDTTTVDGLIVASTSGLNGPAVASTTITMNAVLPAAITAGGQEIFNAPTPIIDSLGVAHKVNFTYQKTSEVPQQWTIVASCPDATTIGAPYDTGLIVQFDANGNPAGYVVNGTLQAASPTLDITWANSASPTSLIMNMGTIGLPDGLRAIGEPGFNGSNVSADGSPPGTFEQTIIDQKSGLIYAKYSNGASTPFAKIPLGLFSNANELLEKMGGVYTTTLASGSYRLEAIGMNGAGDIETSKIESSTIDPTQQLTMMIVDQANYQSNAKVLTVINDMLQATNQIIR